MGWLWKEYLENNVSEELANKINNGVKIVKNNKADNLNKFFTEYEKYNCKNSKSDVKIILKDLIKVESPIHVKDIYESMKYILDKRATAKFKTEILDNIYIVEEDGTETKLTKE